MTYNTKEKLKDQAFNWITRVIFIIITVVTIFPVIWNLYSSFKTNTEFLTNAFALPSGLEWDNYVRALAKSSLGGNLLNSLFVVVVSLVVVLVCAIPASYCLARFRYFGARFVSGMMMTTLFIQATYIMIPLFQQINSLKLLNSLTMLGVLYGANFFSFCIFFLTGLIRAIPFDYDEAAKIDGCSQLRIMVQVIAPLAKPGIITVCMLTAMASWNEYALAQVLILDATKQTVPVGITRLYEIQQYATDWGALFAALVLVLIPTVLLFAVGQKYLLEGIGSGGVKG